MLPHEAVANEDCIACAQHAWLGPEGAEVDTRCACYRIGPGTPGCLEEINDDVHVSVQCAQCGIHGSLQNICQQSLSPGPKQHSLDHFCTPVNPRDTHSVRVPMMV